MIVCACGSTPSLTANEAGDKARTARTAIAAMGGVSGRVERRFLTTLRRAGCVFRTCVFPVVFFPAVVLAIWIPHERFGCVPPGCGFRRAVCLFEFVTSIDRSRGNLND